jgi:hypothetical protein
MRDRYTQVRKPVALAGRSAHGISRIDRKPTSHEDAGVSALREGHRSGWQTRGVSETHRASSSIRVMGLCW